MKKFLMLLLLGLITIPAVFGQKVTSESSSITIFHEEKPKSLISSHWVVKLGGGMLFVRSNDPKADWNFSVGYDFIISKNDGIYLGGHIGTTRIHYNYYYNTDFNPCVYLGPVLGVKRNIGSNRILDCHIGANYSRDFSWSDNNLFLEAGAGVWFNKFLVGLQYNALNCIENSFGYSICINLGIKF